MLKSEILFRAKEAQQFLQQAIDAIEADMSETISDYDFHNAWSELDIINTYVQSKQKQVRTYGIGGVEPLDTIEGFTRTSFGDL